MSKYDDIINLPRPISKKHRPMAIENRAAQFAPFAALTGYDDAVEETARLTDRRIDLTEEMKAELDEVMMQILNREGSERKVKVTYFVPDMLKDGGEYVTKTVTVRRIDMITRELILDDKSRIAINDIYTMEVITENPEDG